MIKLFFNQYKFKLRNILKKIEFKIFQLEKLIGHKFLHNNKI